MASFPEIPRSPTSMDFKKTYGEPDDSYELHAGGEEQYLSLVRTVLEFGEKRNAERTGVGTLACFSLKRRYSLRNGTLPLLTTKKMFTRGIFEELVSFFIPGKTDGKILLDKNVRIWEANGSREFLDSRGISKERREHDLGPIYGFQWRYFGAPYKDCDTDYSGQGVDQLKKLIEGLKKDPQGRRHIICAWNPAQEPEMALPACHLFAQFFVSNEKYLKCVMVQRSGDIGLGVPFNITSYSLLTHIIAEICDLEADEFIHEIEDAHIYTNHIEPLIKQLKRDPLGFPTIEFTRKLTDIDDVKVSDFKVVDYRSHPLIPMKMAV